MKNRVLLFFFIISSFFYLYADYKQNINLLLYDLKNINTIAYKPIKMIEKNYIFMQGGLTKFNTDLSFALVGDGFFKIYNANNEIFYTRAAIFIINEYGDLQTHKDMYLKKNNNKTIKKLYVEKNGMLMITYTDESVEKFKIELYVPDIKSKNICFGNYYYFSEVKKIEGTKFINGFIELSSIDAFNTVLELQKEFYHLYKIKFMDKDKYEYNMKIIEKIQDYLIIKSFYKSEDFFIDFHNQNIRLQTDDFISKLINFFILD